MKKIHHKTLLDLEFTNVLQLVQNLCLTPKAQEQVQHITAFENSENLKTALYQTNEFLASFENKNAIPVHFFEDIDKELKLLPIEGSTLDISGFVRIKKLCETVNAHIPFFEKFQNYYPHLYLLSKNMPLGKEIPQEIDKVFDKFGEIKNEASSELFQIRKEQNLIKQKIGQSFLQALSYCLSQDYLDDIRESVIDNRRVLAVKAMHRKRVQGVVIGASKTGSIVFIEPQTTEHYSRELSHLLFQERQEIERILLQLTDFIRPYYSQLFDYQKYLTHIDVIYAKAKFAEQTHSILPEITSERTLFLKDALHPLLFLNNQKQNKPTFAQTIGLDDTSRIIVISGPNAGGKSITLKTIGLLQLMLQSGFLVPVHRESKMCLFEHILTDIGDNQSIENHLSTYSYRLKNMQYFLRKCNAQTLFLIDEFGTGSDPELGGALAEVFLEEFYQRKAFGVITTHYTNLKILADELPCATNANMLFNEQSLKPIFKLVVGQAGSSFTFEVAQKNGIAYSLINRAKKKIEKGKVRFDATIARLQKERASMEETNTSLRLEEQKMRQEAQKMEELNDKMQHKLSNYQQLYDHNQRLISLGGKVDEIAQAYYKNGNRRPLVSSFLKIIETENNKRKASEKQAFEKQEQLRIKEQISKEIQAIRKQKKQEENAEKIALKQQQQQVTRALKIGDRVRLKEGKTVGVIDKIEKEKALINYGFFISLTPLNQLELVQKMS